MGEASATGDGDLSLDEKLQPLGAFSASFQGLDSAVDAYEKAGKLNKSKASLLRLGAMAAHGNKISITIQNRKLLIAAIPVAELKEIVW